MVSHTQSSFFVVVVRLMRALKFGQCGQQGLSGHSAHCHSAFRFRYKKGSLVCYTAFFRVA